MSVWNLTKYFLISKQFWLLSMHTATVFFLSRYTACFILKLLSKIAILTGTNYSKCKQKYDFFFVLQENLGYLTLWSKPVIFPSCSTHPQPARPSCGWHFSFYDHNNLKQQNQSKNAHVQNQKCSWSHFTVFSLCFVSTWLEWAGCRSSIIYFLKENDFGTTKGS